MEIIPVLCNIQKQHKTSTEYSVSVQAPKSTLFIHIQFLAHPQH